MELAIIPRSLLRWLIDNDAREIHANILLSNFMVVALAIGLNESAYKLASFSHECLFHLLWQIPCPGCGVTRSILEVSAGNIISSWRHNPAGTILFAYFLMQIPLRGLALISDQWPVQRERASRFGGHAVIAMMLLVWLGRVVTL